MDIVDQLMCRPEFVDRPPVFVEVGAAGGTHGPWHRLSQYSVCLAFDPDLRDMASVQDEQSSYRRLYVYPAAAVDRPIEEAEFHLTTSPHCSSLLKPHSEKLRQWLFFDEFQVKSTDCVRCVSLPTALTEVGIDYVDWFKTDSQGMDLRLFRSLGKRICSRTLAVEFEPGFMDAYVGEDKLHAVLASMDGDDFWLSSLRVRGTQRVDLGLLSKHGARSEFRRNRDLPRSPGWGEMLYLNTFLGDAPFDLRDRLLGWVIATVLRQHGFALELAERGASVSDDAIFPDLIRHSLTRIEPRGVRSWPGRARRVFVELLRRALARLEK